MDRVALRQVSLLVLRFFPRGIFPPMLVLTFICKLLPQERQTAKSGNSPKSVVISQIGERWMGNYFRLFLFFE